MTDIKSQMQELITAVKESTAATREGTTATKEVTVSVNGLKTEQSTLMRWAIGALIIIALGQTGIEIVKSVINREMPAMAEVKK